MCWHSIFVVVLNRLGKFRHARKHSHQSAKQFGEIRDLAGHSVVAETGDCLVLAFENCAVASTK
jgi:hypothetical protein